MRTAMFENLELELEMAADRLSLGSRAEAESATSTRCYWDVWTWTAGGWVYLGREGPHQMTKDQAVGHVFTLRLKYQAHARSLGGDTAHVQCFAFKPQSNTWVPCQNLT